MVTMNAPENKPGSVLAASRAFNALKELMQGARPLIYIRTSEEGRARQLLQEAGGILFPEPVPVWGWSSPIRVAR